MYGVSILDKDFLMAGFSGVAFSSAVKHKQCFNEVKNVLSLGLCLRAYMNSAFFL